MSVELPKDAKGREIPLDTVVLFNARGDASEAGDARYYGVCAYFHRDKDEDGCTSCPGGEDGCARIAMRDIADRIRKLRGEGYALLHFRNARGKDEGTAYRLLPKSMDASPLIGGFPAGQIAYPVAVVLLESGDVVTVNAETVTIDAPEDLFRQYAWIGGED